MHHMWRYSSVARATGSYPVGRKFKSHCRYHIWPVGQAVKTPPFHGGITSSILVRVTTFRHYENSAESSVKITATADYIDVRTGNSQSRFFQITAKAVYIDGPLVKRLRHRPFTAVSRVRFSYGSPKDTSGCPFYCVCES